MRKISRLHLIILGGVTIAASILYIFLNTVVAPLAKDATSFQFKALGFVDFAYVLFMGSMFVSSVIFLLRRSRLVSFGYLMAGAAAYASLYVAAALKDDRLTFPAGSHREIASIYHEQNFNFEASSGSSHLVSLDGKCHPPNGCACWILIDPSHRSGAENDLGGWRRPTAPIFPHALPRQFEIVNIRVLDSAAYSVLGCGMDIREWIPG
jgi:hypothetical protein